MKYNLGRLIFFFLIFSGVFFVSSQRYVDSCGGDCPLPTSSSCPSSYTCEECLNLPNTQEDACSCSMFMYCQNTYDCHCSCETWMCDCSTPTPTIVPTSTPTNSPQPSEEPTPTTTPEPTVLDICANIDGVQTSVPEGKHIDASGKNCVEFGVPGVPEPSDSGIGGGEVLGVSTMAETGVAMDNFFYGIFTLGTMLSSLGIMKNGKKQEKV